MAGDYVTVDGTAEAETAVRGSRFIGIVMNCPDADSVRTCLDEVCARYPNATHYCYAAVYGGSSCIERFSDNGEPSGTAGKPILSALKGAGLSDAVCIVVRYFGGTLLGTGGLVHAYTECAAAALSSAKRVRKVWCTQYSVVLDYYFYNKFLPTFKSVLVGEPIADFTDRVSLKLSVREEDAEAFLEMMSDFGSGKIVPMHLGHGYSDVPFV